MKNLKKKIVSAALALVLAATTLTPVTVKADVTYNNEQTVYMTGKTSGYVSIYVNDLGKNESVRTKDVSSNKKSIVKPYSVSTWSDNYTSKYEYIENSAWNSEDKTSNKYSYIGCELLKKGSAKVSFKVYNSKTKKTSKAKTVTVDVKAYENPASTVEIAGIKNGKSTNLASKTKVQNSANLKLNSKKKDAKVYVKANTKKKWKITSATVDNEKKGTTYSIRNANGMNDVKFNNIGTINKNDKVRVSVSYYNTDTKGTLSTYYYVNYNY